MSDSNAILQAIRVLKAQGVLPNLNQSGNAALQSLVSEAWMPPALQALIGVHPTRIFHDDEPLLIDDEPIFHTPD